MDISLFHEILDQALQLPASYSLHKKEELYKYTFSLTKQDFRKGNRVLITEGNVATNIYFLLRGACRFSFYSKSYKQDLVPFLLLSPCVLGEGKSMQKNCSARFNIEVSAFSTVYILNKTALKAIEEKYPEVGTCIDKLIKEQSHEFKLWKKRLRSQSPEQRYLKLKLRKPDVVKLSLKKNIAGHLGVKVPSFSRILKRLTK